MNKIFAKLSILFNGLILSNGSLETPQMVQAGDSGGVAFVITSGTTAKTVGIALGYTTWDYLFLKEKRTSP